MKYLAWVYVVAVVVVLGWVFREYMPVCTVESAVEDARKQKCDCWGSELTLRDDLDAGGLRKTTCLGVMQQTECFIFVDDGVEQVKCM